MVETTRRHCPECGSLFYAYFHEYDEMYCLECEHTEPPTELDTDTGGDTETGVN